MENIGKAIRITRQALGLKLSEVARRAEISNPMLSLIEKGERQPSLAVTARIAAALQIPTDALVVLGQGNSGSLRTSNSSARRIVSSIRHLAEAERRLREHIREMGTPADENQRSYD